MKLTLYKKIMLGFGAIITIMIISSAYGLFELNTVSNLTKHILTSNIRTREIARQLQAIIQDENGYIEKYLVSNDETYFSLFVETRKQVDHYLNLLGKEQSGSSKKAMISAMLKAHRALTAGIQKKEDEHQPVANKGQALIRKKNLKILFDSLDILINQNQSFIRAEMNRIESISARSVQAAIILIAGTLITAITAAIIITRTITQPIGDLIKGTEQIARGKFEKIHVKSHDEISLLADAVNKMSARISDTNKLRAHTMQQISHELKTPLQAVLSAHDVLKASGAVRDDRLGMLDIIRNGIDKMAGFSQQYLDPAKIESGLMQYDMEFSNLYEIVEPVVEEAKFIARSKHIHIEFNADTIPETMLDKTKVSIIINNLISNAVKYTPEHGKILVTIGSCDNCIRVQVKDSGIGISQDEIQNIFMRFYQAGNIKQVTAKGSGVGLAIVKAYTKGHGGRVYVESSIDKGSIFTVEFPIVNKQNFKINNTAGTS